MTEGLTPEDKAKRVDDTLQHNKAGQGTDLSSETLANGLKVATAREPHRTVIRIGFALFTQPGVREPWDTWCERAEPCSIAFDGRVTGKSEVDRDRRIASFDHHDEATRAATYSTSRQTYLAITDDKLFDHFQINDNPTANIFVNDCDPDVCLSVWLLQNNELVLSTEKQKEIEALVDLVDRFDRLGGAKPVDPNSDKAKKMAWIFEPYEMARMHGNKDISELSGSEMATIIQAVGQRISTYIDGYGGIRKLDTSYDKIGGGDNWSLVEEKGYYARLGLVHTGNEAFVSVRTVDDEHFVYTIGRFGAFSDFNIKGLFEILNAAEGISEGDADRWGGGDQIGGSPTEGRSKIKPKELEAIINAVIKFRNGGKLTDDMIEKFINEKLPEVYPRAAA